MSSFTQDTAAHNTEYVIARQTAALEEAAKRFQKDAQELERAIKRKEQKISLLILLGAGLLTMPILSTSMVIGSRVLIANGHLVFDGMTIRQYAQVGAIAPIFSSILSAVAVLLSGKATALAFGFSIPVTLTATTALLISYKHIPIALGVLGTGLGVFAIPVSLFCTLSIWSCCVCLHRDTSNNTPHKAQAASLQAFLDPPTKQKLLVASL